MCIYSKNEQNTREKNVRCTRPLWRFSVAGKTWICCGFIVVFAQCQAIMIIQPEIVLQYLPRMGWIFKKGHFTCNLATWILFCHYRCYCCGCCCCCWCCWWLSCQLTELFSTKTLSWTTMTITEITAKAASAKDNHFKMHEKQQKITNESPTSGEEACLVSVGRIKSTVFENYKYAGCVMRRQ